MESLRKLNDGQSIVPVLDLLSLVSGHVAREDCEGRVFEVTVLRGHMHWSK